MGAPSLIQKMAAFNRWASEDFLGGPRVLKMAWVVNLQKGGTLAFVGLLMAWFHNGRPEAWIYWAMHGAYGIAWVVKDSVFPDPNWQKKVTFGGALLAWLLVLGPYWVAPFLLISPYFQDQRWPTSWPRIGISVVLFVTGLVLMIGADAQKFFTLKVKRGLITDGFFKHLRHPNYLGEMMLYGALALLVGHWLPFAILAFVWIQVFLPNMLMKEASMARYPEWAAYRARTGLLWPRFGAHPPASAPAGAAADPDRA